MSIEAWRVHDTGLVAAPGRFRRLSGLVRHHRGEGDGWPRSVTLALADGLLEVRDGEGGLVGAWPVPEVRARVQSAGPPVQFVLEVPGAAQLLAAASGDATEALLAALGADREPGPT